MRRTAMMLCLVGLTVPVMVSGQRRTQSVSGGEVALGSQMGMTSETVRKLQMALRRAGCNPGAIDGILGPSTRRALRCVRQQVGDEVLEPPADSLGGTTVFPAVPLGRVPVITAPATQITPTLLSPSVVIPVVVAPGVVAPAVVSPVVAPVTVTRMDSVRVPVPTVNAARDSTIRGRNSASDSTLSGHGTGVVTRPAPPIRPDTTR